MTNTTNTLNPVQDNMVKLAKPFYFNLSDIDEVVEYKGYVVSISQNSFGSSIFIYKYDKREDSLFYRNLVEHIHYNEVNATEAEALAYAKGFIDFKLGANTEETVSVAFLQDLGRRNRKYARRAFGHREYDYVTDYLAAESAKYLDPSYLA